MICIPWSEDDLFCKVKNNSDIYALYSKNSFTFASKF